MKKINLSSFLTSTKDYAKKSGTPLRTVQRHVAEGKIKGEKINGKWFIIEGAGYNFYKNKIEKVTRKKTGEIEAKIIPEKKKKHKRNNFTDVIEFQLSGNGLTVKNQIYRYYNTTVKNILKKERGKFTRFQIYITLENNKGEQWQFSSNAWSDTDFKDFYSEIKENEIERIELKEGSRNIIFDKKIIFNGLFSLILYRKIK